VSRFSLSSFYISITQLLLVPKERHGLNSPEMKTPGLDSSVMSTPGIVHKYEKLNKLPVFDKIGNICQACPSIPGKLPRK
jgi:hypothetical protein